MRVIGLIAIVGLVAGCKVDGFACAGDDECVQGGEPGLCIAGNCSYPDAMCPSGYRYAAGLGNALAGECVDEDDVAGTDTDVTGASDGTSGTSTTTDPATSASTTQGVEVTSDPSSSVTGPDVSTTTTTSATETTGTGTTGGRPTCAELRCEGCLACATEDGESCAATREACETEAGCPAIVDCLESCVVAGLCGSDCCAGADPGVLDTAMEAFGCLLDACGQPCEGASEPMCTG